MNTTYHLTLINADGTKSDTLAPPTELPTDLVPGEFVAIPDQNGVPQWHVFCDKQRWWGNGRWNLGGTVSHFDPGSMTEAQMYELRRKLLKVCGWIG